METYVCPARVFDATETITWKHGMSQTGISDLNEKLHGSDTIDSWLFSFQHVVLQPGEYTLTAHRQRTAYCTSTYIDKLYFGWWEVKAADSSYILKALTALSLPTGNSTYTNDTLALTITVESAKTYAFGLFSGKTTTCTGGGGGFSYGNNTLPAEGYWVKTTGSGVKTPALEWNVGTGGAGDAAATAISSSWISELSFTIQPKKADGSDNPCFYEPYNATISAGAVTELLTVPRCQSGPWWIRAERVEISADDSFKIDFAQCLSTGIKASLGYMNVNMGATDKISVDVGGAGDQDVTLNNGEEVDDELAFWWNFRRSNVASTAELFYCNYSDGQGPLWSASNTEDLDWKAHALLTSGATGLRRLNAFHAMPEPPFLQISGTIQEDIEIGVCYRPILCFGDSQSSSSSGTWSRLGLAVQTAFGRPAMLAASSGNKVTIDSATQTCGKHRFKGPPAGNIGIFSAANSYSSGNVVRYLQRYLQANTTVTGPAVLVSTEWDEIVGNYGHIFQMSGVLFVWMGYGVNDLGATTYNWRRETVARLLSDAGSILSNLHRSERATSTADLLNETFIIGLPPWSVWYYPVAWDNAVTYAAGDWVYDSGGPGYYQAQTSSLNKQPSANPTEWGSVVAESVIAANAYSDDYTSPAAEYVGGSAWKTGAYDSQAVALVNRGLNGLAMAYECPFFSPYWRSVDRATMSATRPLFRTEYCAQDGTGPTAEIGLHWAASTDADVIAIAEEAKEVYELGVVQDRARYI